MVDVQQIRNSFEMTHLGFSSLKCLRRAFLMQELH